MEQMHGGYRHGRKREQGKGVHLHALVLPKTREEFGAVAKHWGVSSGEAFDKVWREYKVLKAKSREGQDLAVS